MFRHLRHSLRLFAIACILARYDVLFVFEPLPFLKTLLTPVTLFKKRGLPVRPGQRLALALRAAGPTFIKFGQSLSTRADLVGDEIAQDLGELRDSLPPFPTRVAKAIIAEEFGQPVEKIYQTFDETPVAAASIAQVYFAETMTGHAVAVKILRPDIEYAFAKDLSLLYWLAEQVVSYLPGWRRLKPLEVVATFDASVQMELDLRFEAAAATELHQNMADSPDFNVPVIFWNLSSRRVMTMERIVGIPVHDVAAIRAAGHNVNDILIRLAGGFFKQVFRDGFFHADLHPGNLFVEPNGSIGVVDFGIMGRLDMKTRLFTAQILYGLIKEDYHHVAEVHFTAGYVPSSQSVDHFALALMAIGKPVLGKPLNEISIGRLLGQLFKVTEMFAMETQPQLLLLQKTLVVVEGVGRMLNPNVNMWQLVEPIIAEWAQNTLSPQARVKMGFNDMLHQLSRLPDIMKDAERAMARLSEGTAVSRHTLSVVNAGQNKINREWQAFAWTTLIILSVFLTLLVLKT